MALVQLLMVEDDQELAEFCKEGLWREGFAVDVARDGEEGLRKARSGRYEAVLLDVNLPRMDGVTLLKALRKSGYRGAILMVTCWGQERDKLEGLYGGADDYVTKPFLLSELGARVRSVLRRVKALPSAIVPSSTLRARNLTMDLLKREVHRGHREIQLTKTQFDLLECFMRRPGHVLSQTVLRQRVCGMEFDSGTNTIEVHINYLRSKIDMRTGPSLIRTVRGSGYALDV